MEYFIFLIFARLPRREESGIHYKLVRRSHHRHGARYKLTGALWWWEVSKVTKAHVTENCFNSFRIKHLQIFFQNKIY